MDSIAIDCPSCSEKLEVDSGFAGGVCRCSKCGTLMTVPRDPQRERAETLTRPQRPDAPAGARPAGGATPPPTAETTFTTQSGKSVKLAQAQVPVARRRRKAINAGVIAAFVVFVIGAVLVCILAIAAMSGGSSKPAVNPDESVKQVMGGYDPTQNPLLSRTPNLLGIALDQKTALVIDGSSAGRAWLPLVLDSVAAQFKADSAGRVAQVVIWGEDQARVFPEKPGALGGAEHEKLVAFLNGVVAFGVAEPGPALAAALQHQPAQVLLVTGQDLSDPQTQSLGKLMAEKGAGVRLDVLLISTESQALADLAKASGGLCVELPVQRIAAWQREAEAAHPAP